MAKFAILNGSGAARAPEAKLATIMLCAAVKSRMSVHSTGSHITGPPYTRYTFVSSSPISHLGSFVRVWGLDLCVVRVSGCGFFLGVKRLVLSCTMAMLRRLFSSPSAAAMAGDQESHSARNGRRPLWPV